MMQLFGSTIVSRSHCPTSSLDWAKEEFDVVPDGTIFLADTYSQARGRQGRVWKLYPGQMILTFVLKPSLLDEDICNLACDLDQALLYLNMSLSVAIAQTLISYGVGLKWPNDFVYITKESKIVKVGGILLESIWNGSKLQGFIGGVAINANNKFLESDPLSAIATSLQTIERTKNSEATIDLVALRDDCIASLDLWYKVWLGQDFEKIFAHWKSCQICLNKKISIHYKDGEKISGYMKGVDRQGCLIFIDAEGKERKISFYLVEDLRVIR